MSELPEYQPFPNDRGRNWRQRRLEVPLLLRSLKLPEAPRMLEVGCGQGVALAAFARLRQPQRLVGIDVDPQAVVAARRALNAERIDAEVRVADVRALPFEDGSYDVVVDFGGRVPAARAALGRSMGDACPCGRLRRAPSVVLRTPPQLAPDGSPAPMFVRLGA